MATILYDADLSPAGKRARMALWLAGVEYRRVRVDLGLLDQKSDAYLAMNPSGVVPTYQDADRIVFDSHVIVEYLAERGLSLPGLSSTGADLATRRWMSLEREFARLMRPAVYETVGKDRLRQRFDTWEDAHAALAKRTANAGYLDNIKAVFEEPENASLVQQAARQLIPALGAIEAALEAGPRLGGSELSAADLAVGPRLDAADRLGLVARASMPYPRIAAYLEELREEPCWTGADAHGWDADFHP